MYPYAETPKGPLNYYNPQNFQYYNPQNFQYRMSARELTG